MLGQYGRAFADEVQVSAADLATAFPREAQPAWCLRRAESCRLRAACGSPLFVHRNLARRFSGQSH
jgi:hypothetical protein